MALVAVPGEWRSTPTAPGTASARKPGACRMPPSSAASWAAERRCRRPARLASVPARDRCGRVPVAAPGPRRLSGTARPRHGTAAGAVAGRLPPSAQVSAMRPGIGDRGSGGCLAGPCRDPPIPAPPCRAALPAAGGRQRPLQRAPGGLLQRHLGPRVRQWHQLRHGRRRLPAAGLRGRGEAGGQPHPGSGPCLVGLGALRGGGPFALALPFGTMAPGGLQLRQGRLRRL